MLLDCVALFVSFDVGARCMTSDTTSYLSLDEQK